MYYLQHGLCPLPNLRRLDGTLSGVSVFQVLVECARFSAPRTVTTGQTVRVLTTGSVWAALTRDSAQKPLLYQGFGYRDSRGFTSGIVIRPANLV